MISVRILTKEHSGTVLYIEVVVVMLFFAIVVISVAYFQARVVSRDW